MRTRYACREKLSLTLLHLGTRLIYILGLASSTHGARLIYTWGSPHLHMGLASSTHGARLILTYSTINNTDLHNFTCTHTCTYAWCTFTHAWMLTDRHGRVRKRLAEACLCLVDQHPLLDVVCGLAVREKSPPVLIVCMCTCVCVCEYIGMSVCTHEYTNP
jgi:hypothetical protein